MFCPCCFMPLQPCLSNPTSSPISIYSSRSSSAFLFHEVVFHLPVRNASLEISFLWISRALWPPLDAFKNSIQQKHIEHKWKENCPWELGKGVEEKSSSSSLSISVIRPMSQQFQDITKLLWRCEECVIRVRNYSASLSPPHSQCWFPPFYNKVIKLHCKKPRFLWECARFYGLFWKKR